MVNVAEVSNNDNNEEACTAEGGSGCTSADNEAGSMPVRVWQPKGWPHKYQLSLPL